MTPDTCSLIHPVGVGLQWWLAENELGVDKKWSPWFSWHWEPDQLLHTLSTQVRRSCACFMLLERRPMSPTRWDQWWWPQVIWMTSLKILDKNLANVHCVMPHLGRKSAWVGMWKYIYWREALQKYFMWCYIHPEEFPDCTYEDTYQREPYYCILCPAKFIRRSSLTAHHTSLIHIYCMVLQ